MLDRPKGGGGSFQSSSSRGHAMNQSPWFWNSRICHWMYKKYQMKNVSMKLVLRSICLTCVLTPPKIHYIKSLSITHVKQTYSLGTNICFSILYNLLSKARTVKRRLKGWNIKERYQWPNRNVPAKDGTPSPLTRTPTVSISPGEPVLTRTTVETRKTRPVHRDRGVTQRTRESDGNSAIFLSVASRFQLRTCCEMW